MTLADDFDCSAPARAALWRLGLPSAFLLDDGQRAWLRQLNGPGSDAWVWLIGRQRGKTFAALVDACEFALRTPGAIIRYCAKTKESAQGIVEPNLAIILEDCPEELKPRRRGDRTNVWVFPSTGAELIIFGTDAESFGRGRGPRTHRQYFDECAFYQDLVGVENALMPSLQTTAGKVLYLSSPPESPGHPYVQRIGAARASDHFVHDTFWNNPRVNHDAIIASEAARLGYQTTAEFLLSTYFRREFLAEVVTEGSRAAIPSWTAEAARECVVELPRPEFFDAYVGIDWGFGDPHAATFGYWDHSNGRLVVEDELKVKNANTAVMAAAVKAKETALWGNSRFEGTLLGAEHYRKERGWEHLPDYLKSAINTSAPRQPFLRVGDDDQLVLADMIQLHGLAVMPTRKDNKRSAADGLDILVRARKLKVHPRCVELRRELETVLWAKHSDQWERTEAGHGDVLDSCIYVARNVAKHRDPRPPQKTELERELARIRGERATGLEGLRGLMAPRRRSLR